METGELQSLKDLDSKEFQRELNRWFESHGVIDDLRSHLRHLMITALQNTQIGIKPVFRNSPRIQAVNLLVAEYLLKQHCYYTLSILTSEVPILGSFSKFTPTSILRNREAAITALPSISRKHGKDLEKKEYEKCFQEAEVEELLNALGFSNCAAEMDNITDSYLDPDNDEPLLECLLKTTPDLAVILQARQSSTEFVDPMHVSKGVSHQWSSKIMDILLCSRLKPHRLGPMHDAIVRITENEIQKLVEEENKHQIEILVQREKRIQENLKKHEEEMFLRLNEAESELQIKREVIDKELTQRQRLLSKMAVEWKNRHQEIVSLSRNVKCVQMENESLRESVEQMGSANEILRDRVKSQNQIISEFQNEIAALNKQISEVTASNAVLNGRIQSFISQSAKSQTTFLFSSPPAKLPQVKEGIDEHPLTPVSASSVPRPESQRPIITGPDTPYTQEEGIQTDLNGRPPPIPPHPSLLQMKSCTNREAEAEALQKEFSKCPSGDASPHPYFIPTPTDNDSFEEDCEISLKKYSSCVSPQEEVVTNAWNRFRVLEAESARIEKSYNDYKSKYEIAASSESESSKLYPKRLSRRPSLQQQALPPLRSSAPNILTISKTAQTVPIPEKAPFRRSSIAIKSISVPKTGDDVFPSPQETVKKMIGEMSPKRVPTKRQAENHSFFLRSRSLVEKMTSEQTSTPDSSLSSNIDTSYRNSPRVSSSILSKAKKSSSLNVYTNKFTKNGEHTLDTPLKTVSFYYSEEVKPLTPQHRSESSGIRSPVMERSNPRVQLAPSSPQMGSLSHGLERGNSRSSTPTMTTLLSPRKSCLSPKAGSIKLSPKKSLRQQILTDSDDASSSKLRAALSAGEKSPSEFDFWN